LTARVAWALGRAQEAPESRQRIVELTEHADLLVQRCAWESIAGWNSNFVQPTPQWERALSSSDRRLRWSAMLAARGAARDNYARWKQTVAVTNDRMILAHLWINAPPDGELPSVPAPFIDTCLSVFARSDIAETQLEAVRLIQIATGDVRTREGLAEVYSGYTGNATDRVPAEIRMKIADRLAPCFPTGHAELDWELGRLFCMVEARPAGLIDRVAIQWTNTSPPEDDVHYLIVASRLPGSRSLEVTRRTASALVVLHAKLEAQQKLVSLNFPQRVGEALGGLLERDPSLAEAIVDHPAFGRSDHGMFAERFAGPPRFAAVKKLFAAAVGNRPDVRATWTPQLIELVAELPSQEILPELRGQWHDAGLRDAIALVLARHRMSEDRPRLVEALRSAQPHVVLEAARALRDYPDPGSLAEISSALASLRRFCDLDTAADARKALAGLLVSWTGQDLPVDAGVDGNPPLDAYRPWFDWFAKAYPEQAGANGAASVTAWNQRLTRIDWTAGDAAHGGDVFKRKACHQCHAQTGRLGPDLTGVAGRLSRADLFSEIIEPSKNVSPLYAPMLIETRSGQIYQGLLIYDSPESTLLQTGPDVTVRLTGDQVLTIKPGTLSLMPAGLLDDVNDSEVADLYAYLKTLD
jgi:putative heme-binding domain-containing protein